MKPGTKVKMLWLAVVMGLIGFGMAADSYADCPDKVNCMTDTQYYSNIWGTFNVPTCYTFGHGCKPWHCNGIYKDTNREYWTNKCRQSFPSCTASNGCEATFPGAPVQ